MILHDHRVSAADNEAERLLRIYRQKRQQDAPYKNLENPEYLCRGMSMLVIMYQREGANIFNRVIRILMLRAVSIIGLRWSN